MWCVGLGVTELSSEVFTVLTKSTTEPQFGIANIRGIHCADSCVEMVCPAQAD